MIDNLKEPEESLPLSTPYLTFTGEVTGEHEVINIDDDNDKINTFKISRCLYNYFSRENEEKKKTSRYLWYIMTQRGSNPSQNMLKKTLSFMFREIYVLARSCC